MTQRDRLKIWVSFLTDEQKGKILLEMTDLAINSEYVNFPDDSKSPYYDGDGENIDGTERED